MSLVIQDLRVTAGEKLLAEVPALSVQRGKMAALLGPSGAGKSTVLKAIAGLSEPNWTTGGQISLDGQRLDPLPAHLRRASLMFQSATLYPHLDVAGNIGLAMPRRVGEHSAQRRERIEQWLDVVELGGFASRDPASLSGGQQSRVALARALACEPQVLLLDEPFSALDDQLRGQIRELTFSLVARHQLVAVMVSHQKSDTQTSQIPVQVYQMRDGKIEVESP